MQVGYDSEVGQGDISSENSTGAFDEVIGFIEPGWQTCSKRILNESIPMLRMAYGVFMVRVYKFSGIISVQIRIPHTPAKIM